VIYSRKRYYHGKESKTWGKKVFRDFVEWSKIRTYKTIRNHESYTKIVREIWAEIAQSAIEYEGGVYDHRFLYFTSHHYPGTGPINLIRQGQSRKIIFNKHTEGRVFGIVYCNIMPHPRHRIWIPDRSYINSYRTKFSNYYIENNPIYTFNLPTLKKLRFR
jgi:hypothetical protein